eukprot:scaffold11032_cov122-Cylindrotheca_fusiformis.AAC.21
MKVSYSLTVASVVLSATTAFVVPTIHNHATLHTVSNSRLLVASEEVASEETAAAEPVKATDIDTDIPEEEVIAKIGVTKDELAIGINARDFLKYAGTKEELIQKFKEDNPSFDDARAAMEVSRFMMDAEIVNAYLRYKENPPDPSLMEQSLDDPATLSSYALFLAGGIGIGYFRKNIYQPKVDSGEWQAIHFPWENTNEAANSVAQSAGDAIDAVSTVLQSSSDQLSSM